MPEAVVMWRASSLSGCMWRRRDRAIYPRERLGYKVAQAYLPALLDPTGTAPGKALRGLDTWCSAAFKPAAVRVFEQLTGRT